MQIVERLGEFYLGRSVDPKSGEVVENPYLYASSDLLTHAMIVGMTGSGKTGLGIDLLEEAVLDRIPALVIDPKGDMANLLLNDVALSGETLVSWISPQAAEQAGMDPLAFAKAQAEQKKADLQEEGMDASRMEILSKADKVIYTPGSHTGVPLSIFHLAQPPSSIRQAGDLFQEYLSSTVASLLSFVGEEANPFTSPAFLFLSTLLQQRWEAGESLDLPTLIGAIQQPGIDKIGVLPLESTYPSKERFALAMRFNALLATPKFSAWLDGDPLDIQNMLYTPQGRPRLAIVSIRHLSDAERMFVVTLLLNQLVAWMRRQPGQPSLRALCYMDEIQGFFPPIANPPSKAPMMTLLKQARAFGLGMVLATQNPADLDYKGLSNIGTWFIGHLQTAQDRARLLEGMDESAELDGLLASLPKRTFLVHNIHEPGLTLFRTRQTLSYLAGPLSGEQLKKLTETSGIPKNPLTSQAVPQASKEEDSEEQTAQRTVPDDSMDVPTDGLSNTLPILSESLPTYYLSDQPGVYAPMILGAAHVLYEDAKADFTEDRDWVYLAEVPVNPMPADWENAKRINAADCSLISHAPKDAEYVQSDLSALTKKHLQDWKKNLKDYIYAEERLEIPYHAQTKLSGSPGDPQGFRIAVENALRVQRDEAMQKLKEKYERKIQTLEERIRKANQTLDRQQSRAKNAKKDTAVSLGAALLGGLLGKKALSVTNLGRMSRTARSFSRQQARNEDVSRAYDNVEAAEEQREQLQREMDAELTELSQQYEESLDAIETRTIPPKKMNIRVQDLLLVWVPEERRRG